jgi:hypothetical protein
MHCMMRRTVLVVVTETLTLVWTDAAGQPNTAPAGNDEGPPELVQTIASVHVSSSVVVSARPHVTSASRLGVNHVP